MRLHRLEKWRKRNVLIGRSKEKKDREIDTKTDRHRCR